MESISHIIVPFILVLCSFGILFGGTSVFGGFLEGAKEGLDTCLRLIPTFTALCVAVELLKISGFGELAARFFGGALSAAGLPDELAAFVFLRPISGSAAITMLDSVFESCGADSYAAYLASVIMGSGDTLVYIISVYYAAIGVNKTGHTLISALASAFFSLLVCSAVCKFLFFI
ncbi:MAG: spore maturation protein [Ruminococcaceae bacterium]|nr:spore maturation protein [Oscillospiraceae bacterium]